jgi:hypothetical protein
LELSRPQPALDLWDLDLGIWDFRGCPAAVAYTLLNPLRMNAPLDLFGHSSLRAIAPNFWERLANDEQLQDCSALEKLVAGCELIAALDQIELLLAA